MKQWPTGNAPVGTGTGKQNVDVIVTQANQTVLFQPQNSRASQWLHRRCGLIADKISWDTELRVHPRKCQGIIAELKAAGFTVADGKAELC